MFSTKQFWDNRYKLGQNSGTGSRGILAEFKAKTVNNFINKYNINSVIEFGCGDGYQLGLGNYNEYLGYDITPTSIVICNEMYKDNKDKQFKLYDPYNFIPIKKDLVLSLDVIFHLIEDDIYNLYINHVFNSSNKFVIIYSSNTNIPIDKNTAKHVKHRKFTDDIQNKYKDWKLIETIINPYKYHPQNNPKGSFSDFFIYSK